MSLSKTKSSSPFRGVFTALATPFLPNGELDLKNFERLLQEQLRAGVAGVVPCGTTGESPTLNEEEWKTLVELSIKAFRGKGLVIAGTGSNDTRKTIDTTVKAAGLGADAALVVTPYYNKPSQAGLTDHYLAIADASSIPIILYNVPGRTNVSLSARTLQRLAGHPKIVGIKEATGNMALLTEMRVAVAKSGRSTPFSFLSGDDVTYWPFLACGGDGVISVSSNLLPRSMVALQEDWEEGRVGAGLTLHEKLNDFFATLFIEANPVPLKQTLEWLGRSNAKTRSPLSPLSAESAQRLRAAWDQLPSHLKNDEPREDLQHGR